MCAKPRDNMPRCSWADRVLRDLAFRGFMRKNSVYVLQSGCHRRVRTKLKLRRRMGKKIPPQVVRFTRKFAKKCPLGEKFKPFKTRDRRAGDQKSVTGSRRLFNAVKSIPRFECRTGLHFFGQVLS